MYHRAATAVELATRVRWLNLSMPSNLSDSTRALGSEPSSVSVVSQLGLKFCMSGTANAGCAAKSPKPMATARLVHNDSTRRLRVFGLPKLHLLVVTAYLLAPQGRILPAAPPFLLRRPQLARPSWGRQRSQSPLST